MLLKKGSRPFIGVAIAWYLREFTLQGIEPEEFWDILGGPSEDPIPVSH